MSNKSKNSRTLTKTIPLLDLYEDVSSKITYNEFREVQYHFTSYVAYWVKHFSEKFFANNPMIKRLVIEHPKMEWRVSANNPLKLTAILDFGTEMILQDATQFSTENKISQLDIEIRY